MVCNDFLAFQRRHTSVRWATESSTCFPCVIDTTSEGRFISVVLHRPIECTRLIRHIRLSTVTANCGVGRSASGTISQQRYHSAIQHLDKGNIQQMKATPSVIAGILFAVLVLILVLRVWVKGGILPPHEFAYGTALRNCEEIPEQMDQFLSLEVMDTDEIQIQTFVGNRSEKNLTPLISYISSQKNHDFGPLIAALKNVDHLSNQKQKAIQLVKTLIPYKDLLRNEPQQDAIIVFVYYGLKQPSNLSQEARLKISNLVRQLDTSKQSAEFDSGECPENYLVGNINIYPLGLENSFWHKTVEFATPKEAPVLEIRFMGLKGVFKYLLAEMTGKTGDSFLHLDGESI
jgi:hypothetical protein